MAETTDLPQPTLALTPILAPDRSTDWRDIQQARAGDEQACVRLFERYQGEVARQMHRFSRDRGVWEELTHEVFVEVYLSLPRYRPTGVPFVHWLGRIATRVGYRYWKSQARRRTEIPLLGLDAPAPAAAANESAAAATLLHGLLARLPAADRLVLTLMYLEACSVLEIAQRTGWNRAVVKMRAFRARRKLKGLIEKTGVLEELRSMI